MHKGLAFINAQAIFTHLCVMYPDYISTFANYGCTYCVSVQIKGTKKEAQEFRKELLKGCSEGVEDDLYYHRPIKRWCLSIYWRGLE